MSHILAFPLCLAGFAAFAFATDRQQRDFFGCVLRKSATCAMHAAGTCALLLALVILVTWQGWGLGLVMFSGHTSLAAGVVYCALIGFKRARPAA